ncbi:dihydrolipoyl dehydrogenase [Clostridium algidicarnis]|uniref:dihydrolipoyl dehydrogenase n=1 Tax=Clostridium algidicarnis TaxID=37659 RepID=UPI001C0E2B5F|nr:dihydrolipoyl dehydrogenase [Clostridium algidicarnis]MBU3192366.1 dihydrolipoyl dehydrogenase [Clostridium algidicarnis]MBU3204486.1 dihydrolipoyl dehydrogenase [Clostridium algidicarnis]MBU3212431.1 dihydrolipoyl dehydrogenase [Clostridium algidicarnis]MBU3222862.1 dihydrolipoyl dehydrogenase [Clostridium algidicarnis]
MDKDIIIIGGGPGGYVAAIRAAQLGLNVTVIEKDKLGGTCLNRGCIPTKALYRNAEILNILENIDEFGISVSDYSINVAKVQDRKNKIVHTLVSGVEQLLKANKVEVISGEATLKDKNTVTVKTADGVQDIRTKNIIIATGSVPYMPSIKGIEEKGVVTSDELLEFEEIPEELVVLGGGVIGLEFAGIFNAMKTKVKVIKASTTIFPSVDSDITKRYSAYLKKQGIEVQSSVDVKSIERQGEKLVIKAEGKKGEMSITADTILISKGRRANVKGLDIESLGIVMDKKGIRVDENLKTNIEGIYAIGDVNGISLLAHAASSQGVYAVEHIAGLTNKRYEAIIPDCIFVFPEIASVGVTEDEAKKRELEYNASKFMFGANGKALSLGEGDGFIKILSLKEDDTIIGVHIMGPHASDLIHEGALAINNKLGVEDIKKTVHAHPTLSEAFYEAALGLKKEAIHIAPPRK